jgi:hypothetical protein
LAWKSDYYHGLLDIVHSKMLGRCAVDAAVGGYTDVVVAHWQGEWVLVPLGLVVMGERWISKLDSFCAQLLPPAGKA